METTPPPLWRPFHAACAFQAFNALREHGEATELPCELCHRTGEVWLYEVGWKP